MAFFSRFYIHDATDKDRQDIQEFVRRETLEFVLGGW
jgi:hypothetical protein